MKNKQYLIGCAMTAAAAMVMVPQVAFAAGFASTAQSGTATGMGGVATANPDEPNANFYNPASMVFRESWNIYAGPTFILPDVSYTSPDGNTTEQTDSGLFTPPNFSLVVPFADDFAAGVGVTFPWGLGIDWPDDWDGRENFRNQSLETMNVNPNVAYNVPGIELGIAVGAQVMRATLTQGRAAVLRDDHVVDINLSGTGYGFGGTFAAMYQPTDEITVGLNYRSGARLKFDGHAQFSENVEGTPFENRMIDQQITTEMSVPHTVNLGLGWQVLDELWLGLDVNYMTWSVYDELELEYSHQSPEGEPGSTDPSTVIVSDWNDAVALRLGGQYDVIDDFSVRLGFAYDMTPVPDGTVGPSLPDNDRYIFSAGFGYEVQGFRTDLGYNYVYLNERTIENESVNGDYQLSSHVLGLNVGYGF